MSKAEPQCPYCGRGFVPSRFRLQQKICSRPPCQSRRKREYHRQKVLVDPEYRQVCRDSRQKWRAENPDYQRQYREAHPEYVRRNREAQRRSDRKRRMDRLVKNNLALDLKRSFAEAWLIDPAAGDLVKNNLAFSQVMIFQRVEDAALVGG